MVKPKFPSNLKFSQRSELTKFKINTKKSIPSFYNSKFIVMRIL